MTQQATRSTLPDPPAGRTPAGPEVIRRRLLAAITAIALLAFAGAFLVGALVKQKASPVAKLATPVSFGTRLHAELTPVEPAPSIPAMKTTTTTTTTTIPIVVQSTTSTPSVVQRTTSTPNVVRTATTGGGGGGGGGGHPIGSS